MSKLHDDEHVIINLFDGEVYGDYCGMVAVGYPEDESGTIDTGRVLWTAKLSGLDRDKYEEDDWILPANLTAEVREQLDNRDVRL